MVAGDQTAPSIAIAFDSEPDQRGPPGADKVVHSPAPPQERAKPLWTRTSFSPRQGSVDRAPSLHHTH